MKEGRSIYRNGMKYVPYRTEKGSIILALDPDSYQDIVDMPDPIVTSFGIQVYNYTTITIYIKMGGAGTGWNWATPPQLGSVASGGNVYFIAKDLGSRAKPGSAVDDSITLTVRAYSDAGYTLEIGDGYPIIVTYHWLNSAAMSLLDLDNFDGGTLEGWSVVAENGTDPVIEIATDYVLSAPNSCRAGNYKFGAMDVSGYQLLARIEKTFAVPACTKAYFICNAKMKMESYGGSWNNPNNGGLAWSLMAIAYGAGTGTPVTYLGGNQYLYSWYGNMFSAPGPKYSNWQRLVGPLPTNQSVDVKARFGATRWVTYAESDAYFRQRCYFDDLKVVYS